MQPQQQQAQNPPILVDVDGQMYQWRWAPIVRVCPTCGERAMGAYQWFRVVPQSVLATNGGYQATAHSIPESSFVICLWCYHREKQKLGADGQWETTHVQDVETIEEEPQ